MSTSRTLRRCFLPLGAIALLAGFPALGRADEVKLDAEKGAHDVRRAVKKGGHRVEEATCTAGEARCTGRKLKHRVQEAGDRAGDSLNEAQDKK